MTIKYKPLTIADYNSMESSIVDSTIHYLKMLSNRVNIWKDSDYTDNLKFISEAVIAFRRLPSPKAKLVIEMCRDLICSENTKRAIAVQPMISTYFLTGYANLPELSREPSWTDYFIRIANKFPMILDELQPYRIDEIDFARKKLRNKLFRKKANFGRFIANGAHLTRDQVYAFTHQYFYISDYLSKTIDHSRQKHLDKFLELQMMRSYFTNDIDVFIEVYLCYLNNSEYNSGIDVYSYFLYKLFERDRYRNLLLHDSVGFNFDKFYHQCFLFVMLSNTERFNKAKEAAFSGTMTCEFCLNSMAAIQRFFFSRRLLGLDISGVYKFYIENIEESDSGYFRVLLDGYSKAIRESGVLENVI